MSSVNATCMVKDLYQKIQFYSQNFIVLTIFVPMS